MKFRLPKRCKIVGNKGNYVEAPKWGDVKIKFKGRNNKVVLPQKVNGRINIFIHGDNNTVIIKSTDFLIVQVCIGVPDTVCKGAMLEIGERTAMNGVNFMLLENDSFVKVGPDCLFSTGIEIWCTDTHSICNMDGKVTNAGKSVEIGHHVWVGRNCSIAKNTKIPDDSVVGWCSNVTRKFDENHVVIAGNPAEIVKRNVDWRRERPQMLLDEENK